eukprot:scaffold8977_cov128-Isochrysis_galbana.AAC.1
MPRERDARAVGRSAHLEEDDKDHVPWLLIDSSVGNDDERDADERVERDLESNLDGRVPSVACQHVGERQCRRDAPAEKGVGVA